MKAGRMEKGEDFAFSNEEKIIEMVSFVSFYFVFYHFDSLLLFILF